MHAVAAEGSSCVWCMPQLPQKVQVAFDACRRRLYFRRDSNFSYVLPCNSLLQRRSCQWALKAHSHYCVFRMRLRQTVALLRRDRKIPISALTQSTAESADRCGECESALSTIAWTGNINRASYFSMQHSGAGYCTHPDGLQLQSNPSFIT